MGICKAETGSPEERAERAAERLHQPMARREGQGGGRAEASEGQAGGEEGDPRRAGQRASCCRGRSRGGVRRGGGGGLRGGGGVSPPSRYKRGRSPTHIHNLIHSTPESLLPHHDHEINAVPQKSTSTLPVRSDNNKLH